MTTRIFQKLGALLLMLALLMGVFPATTQTVSAADITLDTGDYVNFGTYDGVSILWKVTGVSGSTATLLSEYVLYNAQYDGSSTWNDTKTFTDSTLFAGLNGVSFKSGSFTTAEKSAITGNITVPTKASLSATPSENIATNRAGSAVNYWLAENPFDSSNLWYAYLVYLANGVVSGSVVDTSHGVRPALKINLDSVVFDSGLGTIEEPYVLTVLSNAKEITGFTIPNQVGNTYISYRDEISITMPYGTDVSNLTPTIVYSGTSIAPASDVAQDFTDPVEYTVTAEDGSTKTYTVYIYVEDPELAVESVTPSGIMFPSSADTLTITFNQEMMYGGSVTISGEAALSNPRWNDDMTTITYDLTGLEYNTEYTVTIDDFVSRIERGMSEAHIHTFTTATQTYNVTYNANGGSGTAPSETDKTAGEAFTVANNTFTAPDGWQFKDWNTKSDGTGTGYTEGGEITMPAENLTLYAVWEQIPISSVKVIFDPQGGTVTTTSKTVVYNETYGALPVPIRDGNTFKGWYTTKTGGTKVTAETIVTINEAHTLYAQWEIIEPSPDPDNPDTGDHSQIPYILAVLLSASILGIVVIARKKKKYKCDKNIQ